jgi:dipeptidyl aminopeptidase/acylaminoacyl peptidase
MKLRRLQVFAALHTTALGVALSSLAVFAAPALEVYGNLPAFEIAVLSQSGDRTALIGAVGDTRRLIVLDKNVKPLLNAPLGAMKVRGLFWAGDDTVLIYKSDTRILSNLDFSADKAELFSMLVIPLNGAKAWSVFASEKKITGGVSGFHGVRMRDGKYFGYFGGITLDEGLYGRKILESTDPVLYEVDLQNQATKRISSRLETDGYRRWIVGTDGTASVTLDYYSKVGDWAIRNHGGDKIATGSHPQGRLGLVGLGTNPGTLVYSVEDNQNGKIDWLELPLSGGDAKPVFVDVPVRNAILDSRTQQIMGYRQDADSPTYKFFDARRQKVIDGAMRAFPDRNVHLVDWNDAFDKLIVMTDGTGDPQTWWSVDIKTGRARDLGVSFPMRAQDVAPTRMINYKAGDGLDISAVLTLPPELPPKGLPVVVLPHGGPHARDYPGFDWWAQAFASRGYAVLQPNFRGSDGYGAAFKSAGHGEWGRKMQSDISEGLAHLAKEGIADAKRACIMGASYGGYAALAGVTLQKGIYRCAVSVAGVSDVQKMVATNIETQGRDAMVRRALEEEVGLGKDLREVSPIRFAAAADAPILLIHGKDDVVVHYDQSADMAKALRKAGKPVEFVTLPGEDHWLSTSATRLGMLKAALDFVEKHNPASPSK